MLSIHLKKVLVCFELTDGHLLGITTDNGSSNYSMTWELQSTHEVLRIEWPALWYHIPCMMDVIHPTLGAFISNLGVKGYTKSWKMHEHNHHFGENETADIGKSQRLWKEGITRNNKVSAMRPGLAKIIEKVCIWTKLASPETDHHIVVNDSCTDYVDTWWSKWVHWLSKSEYTNHSTTYYGWEKRVEFDTGVAWASLRIPTIHPQVAQESKIQWLPATLHNTGWMDIHQACDWDVEAIPIPHPVDVKKPYGNSASHYHCLQWHVWLYGWRYASFS